MTGIKRASQNHNGNHKPANPEVDEINLTAEPHPKKVVEEKSLETGKSYLLFSSVWLNSSKGLLKPGFSLLLLRSEVQHFEDRQHNFAD